MDDKVLKYRQKHKRCQYCKHLKYKIIRGSYIDFYYLCEARNNIINAGLMMDMSRVPRWFCKCYEVDVNKC